MSKFKVASEKETRVIQQNHMEQKNYAVMYSNERTIRLLCYDTRDIIVIEKGDRKWS